MEKQPAVRTNPQGAPVKMIKVPVKRPAGAAPVRMVKVPVAPPSGMPMTKAPVRMVKVPVAPQSVGAHPSVQNAPKAPPHLIKRPAVPPVMPAAAPVFEQPQPRAESYGMQAPAPVPAQSVQYEEPESVEDDSPKKFPLPKNILQQIRRLKSPEQKMVMFSAYLRMWAENMAMDGRIRLPELQLKLPRSEAEMAECTPHSGEEAFSMSVNDAAMLIPLIPRLRQLNESTVSVGELLTRENQRLEGHSALRIEDQFGLVLLLIKVDLQIDMCKSAKKELRRSQRRDMDAIKKLEDEQKALQDAFIRAVKRKKFPVDAEKLIKNYFTFAKKEPEKAYRLLTTNPLYFSPIIMEKLPKKFFGLVKPSAADAQLINKKLASFLKNLKV